MEKNSEKKEAAPVAVADAAAVAVDTVAGAVVVETVAEVVEPITTLPEPTIAETEHKANEAAEIKKELGALDKKTIDHIVAAEKEDEQNEPAPIVNENASTVEDPAEQSAIKKRALAAATAADKKRIEDEDAAIINKPKTDAVKTSIEDLKSKIIPPAPEPATNTTPQQQASASQLNDDGTVTPLETTTDKQVVNDGIDIFTVILIIISIAAIIGVVIRLVKPKIKTK